MLKNIVVIGAAARTGKLVVGEAHARGFAVTAFARHPEALRDLPQGVRVVGGDAADTAAVARAVAGADAVILAVGPVAHGPPHVCSEVTRSVVAAMKGEKVERLVCISGAIIGQPDEDLGLLYKALRATTPRDALDDRRLQEKLVVESGLAFTLVRPPRLTDGPRKGPIDVGEHVRVGAMAHVSRADLAAFLVDAVADHLFVGKAVTLHDT